jgi:hypothetical protein
VRTDKKTEKYAGKYGGREGRDYIREIFAEEKLFATGDIEFVNEVIATNTKHAGILVLPTYPVNEVVEAVAGILAEQVRGYIKANGRNSVKRKVFYVDQDGFYIVEKGIKRLEYSLQAMAIDQGVDLDL